MTDILRDLDLFDDLKNAIENGLPVFGTCAGLILLAKDIENQEEKHFGTLDVTVKRNAFGRQCGSFCSFENFNTKIIEMPFIRAPYVSKVNAGVNVLGICREKIVAVRQDNQLGLAFHPELTTDHTVHNYFLDMVKKHKNN